MLRLFGNKPGKIEESKAQPNKTDYRGQVTELDEESQDTIPLVKKSLVQHD